MDEIIAENPFFVIDYKEVGDHWFKSSLTKGQGVLFDDRDMEITFVVRRCEGSEVEVSVGVRAKEQSVNVKAIEAVDNAVGTFRVETGLLWNSRKAESQCFFNPEKRRKSDSLSLL